MIELFEILSLRITNVDIVVYQVNDLQASMQEKKKALEDR